ncbi:MAG: polysaccharide deacetylase family protein [Candidatus Eremiobacterota bacterium]
MKQVIITVDTEGHDGIDPVKRLIWGITADNKECGINHIMDISDRFSARVLFFVDIAEAWDYGRDRIADVIRHIRNRGHDVGVHIHPDHIADKDRFFLWEYTKEEQYEIIKKCTDLYVEITGEQPLAFRAGKYGANQDTLNILDDLGYKYDFSQFFGQKWCGIKPPVAITLPQKIKGLIEIPVIVFRSFKLGKIIRYDKLDAQIDSSEYKHIMQTICSDKRNIIVSLFFHSFSMLDWRKDPDQPVLIPNEEKKFIKALEYIHKSEGFEFISLDDLTNIFYIDDYTFQKESINDILSTKGFIKSLWYTLKRIYSIRAYNRKAQWIIYGGLIFLILIVIVGLLYWIM